MALPIFCEILFRPASNKTKFSMISCQFQIFTHSILEKIGGLRAEIVAICNSESTVPLQSIYGDTLTITQHVTAELKAALERLMLRRQRQRSPSNGSRLLGSPSDDAEPEAVTFQEIGSFCQTFKAEWISRLSRQTEWLLEDTLLPALEQIPVVQEISNNTFMTSFEDKETQAFQNKWEATVDKWCREVSAGVYKRFRLRYSDHWHRLIAQEHLPPAEEFLKRPCFDIQSDPVTFAPISQMLPPWYELLFNNFKKAIMFVSLMIGIIGIAALGWDNWYLIAITSPLWVVAAVFIARKERATLVAKYRSATAADLRSQAAQKIKDRTGQVQRRLKRQVETQLNIYESNIKTWCRNRMIEWTQQQALDSGTLYAETILLNDQIESLESAIGKWTTLSEQLSVQTDSISS